MTATAPSAMTPGYASPEQIKGEAITIAPDVYSPGVILYELLTGQRPFPTESRSAHEIARAVCEQESPPRRARRQLTGDLDNIVATALRKEPSRRYASVAALSDDLRRRLEGHPTLARKDTLGYSWASRSTDAAYQLTT